jgi:apolipoprotein N-acyltransferase
LNFFKDMHWAWSFCIYVAFALIIWIHVEVLFLQTVIWVHTFYIIYALVMIFITLLPRIRIQYKKEDTV